MDLRLGYKYGPCLSSSAMHIANERSERREKDRTVSIFFALAALFAVEKYLHLQKSSTVTSFKRHTDWQAGARDGLDLLKI